MLKKKKKKGLVQKCKPSSSTEDSSLRSPNRKTKEKKRKENLRLRQERESEWLFKKKKKDNCNFFNIGYFFWSKFTTDLLII